MINQSQLRQHAHPSEAKYSQASGPDRQFLYEFIIEWGKEG